MEGWIKLHRRLLEHPLWLGEQFTRGQAWVDMVALANHADGFIRVRGVLIPVMRGQCGWSQAKLASRWRWSEGKIRRFIHELKTLGQIEVQNSNVTQVITICNYDSYQIVEAQTDAQTACKQRTNKNEKNITHIPGIPENEDSAVAMAEMAGVPKWFAIEVYNQLEGRSWVDGAGQRVDHFGKHVKYRWNKRLNTIQEERHRATNQPTRKQGVDRNQGTANEGKASQYKLPAK